MYVYLSLYYKCGTQKKTRVGTHDIFSSTSIFLKATKTTTVTITIN